MATVKHLGLFPFCFDPDQSYFKTKKDLLNIAVPMWWRVKRWTLQHTRVILSGDEITTHNYTDILDVTNTLYAVENNIAIETELDFVCLDRGWGEVGNHLWRVSGGADSVIWLGPNFYILIDDDDMVGADTASDANPKAGEITLTMDILGVSKIISLYYTYVPYIGGFIDLLSVSGTLEPLEWWEYDPNDGKGPIYDKDTGKQLRAFPN